MVGVVNGNSRILYALWALRSIHLSLAAEAKDIGDEKKAQELEAEAARWDELGAGYLEFLRTKSKQH